MNDVFSSTASSSITSNYTTKDKYRKVFIIIKKMATEREGRRMENYQRQTTGGTKMREEMDGTFTTTHNGDGGFRDRESRNSPKTTLLSSAQ